MIGLWSQPNCQLKCKAKSTVWLIIDKGYLHFSRIWRGRGRAQLGRAGQGCWDNRRGDRPAGCLAYGLGQDKSSRPHGPVQLFPSCWRHDQIRHSEWLLVVHLLPCKKYLDNIRKSGYPVLGKTQERTKKTKNEGNVFALGLLLFVLRSVHWLVGKSAPFYWK